MLKRIVKHTPTPVLSTNLSAVQEGIQTLFVIHCKKQGRVLLKKARFSLGRLLTIACSSGY